MFRNSKPVRTIGVTKRNNYRDYRQQLRLDFNRRCGYCDSREDIASIGNAQYHIDHFAPKKRFPLLENEYSNLVYACSRCNIAKSDDWVSDSATQTVVDDKGYLDPCSDEFSDCFDRDSNGNIIGCTPVASYMVKQLKLFRIEYGIVWSLEQIDNVMDKLESVVSKYRNSLDVGRWNQLWNVYTQGRSIQNKLKSYFFR